MGKSKCNNVMPSSRACLNTVYELLSPNLNITASPPLTIVAGFSFHLPVWLFGTGIQGSFDGLQTTFSWIP